MENLLIFINIVLAIILVVIILKIRRWCTWIECLQDNFTSARSVGTFLTKFTSIVAALFIICSIAIVAISQDELK